MKFYHYLLILLVVGCNSKETPNEYLLDELELCPEGIAYSETVDKFFLTSIAKQKIISVDAKTGEQKDFIETLTNGFGPGLGIYVDDGKGEVLALSGYYTRENSETALSRFDLNTAKLLNRYPVVDSGAHFLNDLIMGKKGDVYITDTKAESVYVLRAGSDQLELFLKSPEIEYPNGIAIDDGETKLYVASDTKGVRILDLKTGQIVNDADTTGLSGGIDGLEYYQGNLYGIQNDVEANGDNFRELRLNSDGSQIVGVTIIDANNPKLNVPLTFCIAGHHAVVIGNSNLNFYSSARGEFTSPDSLRHTKLLVYKLPE